MFRGGASPPSVVIIVQHVAMSKRSSPSTLCNHITHGSGSTAELRSRFVKSIPPTTENWLRKLYNYSMNNDTSTEDKHETNHINNKYNDMNMNTRKMHNT